MKTIITIIILAFLGIVSLPASSVIEDLMEQVDRMAENDKITLDYTFEGCFGPYHHGRIKMVLKADTIYYINHSYDGNNTEPLSQAGKYQKNHLMELLEAEKKKAASTVIGNTIDYKIKSDEEEITHGSDHIEQRNFIELFHPLTSIFKPEKKSIIPKLSSGGFVH